MIMTEELSLRDFQFWGGAITRASLLSYKELDFIEEQLIDCYPDGMSKTLINDIFWFEFNWIAEMLGYKNEEELMEFREK